MTGSARPSTSVSLAQLLCVVSIAVLMASGMMGYDGVVLGGVVLITCAAAGTVAFVASVHDLSKVQRDLFRWIALTAVVGSLGKVSWVLHHIANGRRPSFPALPDYLLLAAQLSISIGFLLLLREQRSRLRLEPLADLFLVAVAVGIVLLPLRPFDQGILPGVGVEGRAVAILSLIVAASSLVLLALLITWRGEDLSRRALLGLAVGAVATAVFTAWASQLGVRAAAPSQIPMDILAVAAILGFVSAMDVSRAPATLEMKVAERTAALSGTVEQLKGVISEERAMRTQIIERERLASIGSIVGGVAHEINNPLSSISAFAQLLLLEKDLTTSQRESVGIIQDEAIRAANVIKDLRAFARRSASERQTVDLNEIIARTVRLRGYEMDKGTFRTECDLDPGLPMVTGDAQQLQQVIMNLMSNSIQAMAPAGGEFRIVTRAKDSTVVVEISDSGPGVPPEMRERIFDPFFTTRGVGEGSGLGLSASYGIVAAHGGSLRLADSEPGSTKFVMELPAARWVPDVEGGTGSGEVKSAPGGAQP